MKLTVTDGQDVKKITPKSLHILQYFIKNQGKLVTYRSLSEEVWVTPVDETVVYQQIGILRKALGDSSTNSKYIRTYPKKGYELICPPEYSLEQAIPKNTYGKRKTLKAVCVSILVCTVIIVMGATLLNLASPATNRQLITQAIGSLDKPKTVVALRSYGISYPISGEQDVSIEASQRRLIELLVEYHLDQNPQLHIIHVPDSLDIHTFQRSMPELPLIDYIVQPIITNAGALKFVLKRNRDNSNTINTLSTESQTVTVRVNNTADIVAKTSFESGIIDLEKRILTVLKQENLISSGQAPFLQGPKSDITILLKTVKKLPVLQEIHLSQKMLALKEIQLILSRDPKNLIAYTCMWRLAIAIILSEGSYDIATLLNSLAPNINALQTYYPKYYESTHFLAKYQAWMEEDTAAINNLTEAIKNKAFNAEFILSFSWNVKHKGLDALMVDRHNYILNPFNKMVLTYYVESLLKNKKIDTAAQVLNQYSSWEGVPRDWRLAAQSRSNANLLTEFSRWYQIHHAGVEFDPAKAMEKKLNHFTRLPSRYIGYMLLNAGEAERARFWLEYGREEGIFYFDMRIIHHWIDIWEGNWHASKWQMNYEHAESRHQYQTAFDKYNLLYLHYFSGQYAKAEIYIKQLFPELDEEVVYITKSNLRYASYYLHIQKSQGSYASAKKLTEALKIFISQLEYPIERDLDFGIADIEFYSLTGQTQKALSLLKYAVMEQSWAPNAFWRWPPIENNPSLRSLIQHPQFLELAKHSRRQEKDYCFNEKCE